MSWLMNLVSLWIPDVLAHESRLSLDTRCLGSWISSLSGYQMSWLMNLVSLWIPDVLAHGSRLSLDT